MKGYIGSNRMFEAHLRHPGREIPYGRMTVTVQQDASGRTVGLIVEYRENTSGQLQTIELPIDAVRYLSRLGEELHVADALR